MQKQMKSILRSYIMIFYSNNKLIIKFAVGLVLYFALALFISSALSSCLSDFADKLQVETKASLKEDKRVLTNQLDHAVEANKQIKDDILNLSNSFESEMEKLLLHERSKKQLNDKVKEIQIKHKQEIKIVRAKPKIVKKDVLETHYAAMFASYELAKGY